MRELRDDGQRLTARARSDRDVGSPRQKDYDLTIQYLPEEWNQ